MNHYTKTIQATTGKLTLILNLYARAPVCVHSPLIIYLYRHTCIYYLLYYIRNFYLQYNNLLQCKLFIMMSTLIFMYTKWTNAQRNQTYKSIINGAASERPLSSLSLSFSVYIRDFICMHINSTSTYTT